MKRLIAVAVAAFIFSSCRGPQREAANVEDAAPQYIDSAQCASCHAEIAETYRQTGMGRSVSRAAPQTIGEGFKTGNTFYHAASDQYYTMLEREGRYFQRRHQLGPDGQTTNVDEKE